MFCKRLQFLFTSVLVCIFCPQLPAQQGISVDEIILRHIAALGGQKNIDAVRATVVRGTYREGSFVTDAFMAKMRPYYKTLADPKDLSADINEGYDGSAWEYYQDPGVVIRTVAGAAAAARHGTDITDSLVDRAIFGAQVILAGEETFDSTPCYRLHVTLADGFEKNVYLGKDDYLIHGDRRAAQIHAFGDKVMSENHIGDYRRVSGVLFAYSYREVEISSGKELNSLILREVVVNPGLDASFFSPPQFVHTPLQALLEALYAERTDPLSVMWSYRTFRAVHGDIDTASGIEFIGYQMLKMGDSKAAIELLTANAKEHPASASAEFGLGRAYRSAGDAAEAQKHFQRALRIDPSFKKAADGLNALR